MSRGARRARASRGCKLLASRPLSRVCHCMYVCSVGCALFTHTSAHQKKIHDDGSALCTTNLRSFYETTLYAGQH